MDATAARKRLAEARVAHLATVAETGKPHVVPVTFAVEGDVIYFAVDAKPKRTRNLQRLRNIAANPSVSLLIDHYEEDWSRLWWVRVDGTARIAGDPAETTHALNVLTSRYPQYVHSPPPGPVVTVTIDRITGWTADENPAC